MNANDFVAAVQEKMEAMRDPEQAVPMQKYMKDRFAFLGIKMPERTALSRPLVRALEPAEALMAAEMLWTLPEREHQYVGVDVLGQHVKALQATDLQRVRSLIQLHSWWDTVDVLASRVVGHLVRQDADLLPQMDVWSQDQDFWVRRTAILHQLSYKKHTDEARLFAYALHNASDTEFFIRKAIGWALREYAKTSPEKVLQFVQANRARFSGLTVREALKHF
ncbi:DNA alkylation repair protein [Deinococcus roseus]|uniref:DNA alkylation repair protein n=1 Tax=Deinococcus roseus TaxID=392414 RepID=A0ABQ2CSX1_9DEIO|nr:DNA alkylation repair protein [Deinococcus roseus]GGJ17916.1 hypothetical protein GCM10008938_00030 [Deinococcus roseus]